MTVQKSFFQNNALDIQIKGMIDFGLQIIRNDFRPALLKLEIHGHGRVAMGTTHQAL